MNGATKTPVSTQQNTRTIFLSLMTLAAVSTVACSDADPSTGQGGAAGESMQANGHSPSGGTGDPPGAGGGGGGGSAAGGGSSADGDAPRWETVESPRATEEDQALSCEFVEETNCWKTMVDAALACSPQQVGTLSGDGRSCSFPDGSKVVFSFPVSKEASLIFPEHTLFEPDGGECYSVKSDAIGDFSVRSIGGTAAYDSLSVLSYRVICEDGRSFSSAEPNACPDTAFDFLDGSSPQYILSGRDGAEGQRELVSLVGGSSASERVIGWRCR